MAGVKKTLCTVAEVVASPKRYVFAVVAPVAPLVYPLIYVLEVATV